MNDIPSLKRPAFFDGQALTAADLNAVTAYHRELLWMHQRTLHSAGIVSGLVVTGGKGDKAVSVAPGYAVDDDGRSVVLDAPRAMDIPAVVAGPGGNPVIWYLTIAYVEDDDLHAAARRGTCGSNGAVRRMDAPVLAWREPGKTGQDIVLCGITVANCKLTGPVDLSLRRSALPERQPYVYAGQTDPSSTNWAVWQSGDDEDSPVLGLKVSVNTSKAGFANTPKYQVLVNGFRTYVTAARTALVDGHVSISNASPNGFDLNMTLPKGDTLVNPDWVLKRAVLSMVPDQNNWYVSWVGVEG